MNCDTAPPPGALQPPTPFGQKVWGALSWTVIGHFGSLAIRFVGTIVLSRIFNPEIFGVLALVTTIQIVTHLFTDIGVSQSIIRSPNSHHRKFLDTAWTVQIVRGLVIWLIAALLAAALKAATVLGWVPLGSVYAFPDLPAIIIVSSLVAIIVGFQPTKAIMANRELDMKRVVTIEIVAQLAAFAFTVVVGWATRSIWSYVAAGIIGAALTIMLDRIGLNGPNDRLAWDRESLAELSKFGRWVFFSSAVGGLAGQADRLIMGVLAAPASLGFYSIANNLIGVVDGVAGKVFGTIGLPILSDIQRTAPERLRDVFLRIRWVADSTMVALAGFVFATAPMVVQILYDSRYSDAGWMLQYLSFSLCFARYTLAVYAYLAIGVPHYLTVLSATKLMSLLLLMPAGYLAFGLPGAILAVALNMLPAALWTLFFNSRHGLNSLALELTMLPCWAAGWLVGLATIKALASVKLMLLGLF